MTRVPFNSFTCVGSLASSVVLRAYYGGVDTADMDIALTRFDHKSSMEDGCRSYLRVWWALHGWGISNGWRLRRVWEAEQAESDGWWFYPNGRAYYTPLRAHMKELVDQIIAEAEREGFEPTRKRAGRTWEGKTKSTKLASNGARPDVPRSFG